MNQEKSVQLYNDVLQNCRSGLSAVRLMMDKTDDVDLRNQLRGQEAKYMEIAQQVEQRMDELGAKPEPMGVLNKAGMWAGVQMNTLKDHSSAHLADMMIQGSSMGITQLTRARHQCPDAGEEALSAAQQLLSAEQGNIEALKGFLK